MLHLVLDSAGSIGYGQYLCPPDALDNSGRMVTYSAKGQVEVVYCRFQVPEVEPPCCSKNPPQPVGEPNVPNPIHTGTGQKLQIESDYIGVNGLSYSRTYRSTNRESSSSITKASFADYSAPPGTQLGGCYQSRYFLNGIWKSHCFPYIATGMTEYHLFTADGRTVRFAGPTTSLTKKADVDEELSQKVNAQNEVQWQIRRANDDVEIYSKEGLLISQTTSNGRKTLYTYSDLATPPSVAPNPGLLLTQKDAFGRTLNFPMISLAAWPP